MEKLLRKSYPEVLAVTCPNALDEVMVAIYTELLPEHDPYTDLVPPSGIKLTPRHDAYLKIAEGCNQPKMSVVFASSPFFADT